MLTHTIVAPAQPIAAKAEVLQAERREISDALPFVHALERRKGGGEENELQRKQRVLTFKAAVVHFDKLWKDEASDKDLMEDIVTLLEALNEQHNRKEMDEKDYKENMRDLATRAALITRKLPPDTPKDVRDSYIATWMRVMSGAA
jgi:hypothetical protein